MKRMGTPAKACGGSGGAWATTGVICISRRSEDPGIEDRGKGRTHVVLTTPSGRKKPFRAERGALKPLQLVRGFCVDLLEPGFSKREKKAKSRTEAPGAKQRLKLS